MFKIFLTGFMLLFFHSGVIQFQNGPGNACAFSVGKEREVGEKLLSLVHKRFNLLDDLDITQYVNGIGAEILDAAGSQYFDYKFFVINDRDFNAFAAPSGLVFVNSGLIEMMDSENELFSVLAHECAHVSNRHIAGRIEKSTKVQIGTMAMILAGVALGAGELSEALIAGSMATAASMNLKFSRRDEEEADRQAFEWMVKTERDPAAMYKMLQTMRRIARINRNNIPTYLLTHPEPEARMGYIQDLLLLQGRHSYRNVDEFEFLRMKYRILALSRDRLVLRPRLLKKTKKKNDIMAEFGLSQVYLAEGDYSKAMESLQKVIFAYPGRPILMADRGVIHFQAGRYEKAIESLGSANRADPDCDYTSYYLARTYQQSGDSVRAQGYYKDLLTRFPTYSRLYYNMSEIEALSGQQPAAHYYLGVYHWLEGNRRLAKFHLKEAVKNLNLGNRIRTKADNMLDKIGKIDKK
ncbi:MAG: M48 family metalloprotease [Thermodesulfobacteriota bacterium]|nr:M48 family metalloprotease [Thermodesulfobacteriota bacterium]